MKTLRIGDKVRIKDCVRGRVVGRVEQLEVRNRECVQELVKGVHPETAWVHIRDDANRLYIAFFGDVTRI